MNKLLALTVPALALVACTGTSRIHVALNSDDTQATSQQPLSDAPPAASLTGVQQVNVTITEVDVHVSNEGSGSAGSDSDSTGASNDEIRGEDVRDDDSSWQAVSTTARTVDLMTVRGTNTADLADGTVPAGRITQVRLKLQSSGDAGNGDDRIAGAVVDANGATCDLIVPHSAINPGIKIVGVFQAAHLSGGAAYNAVVNLQLKDSTRLSDAAGASTCAFRLNPVIRIKSVEEDHSGSHGADDGASHH